MTPFQLDKVLSSLGLIVDTREQITDRYESRINSTGLPHERRKLEYGDYSGTYTDLDGVQRTMEREVVIERKMNLDELALCFTRERDRFEREFERAAADGCKVYLIVENATFTKLLNGTYRSKLSANALIASLIAWSIRYNFNFIFCKPDETGRIIKEILYRELKERLTKGNNEQCTV